MTERQAAVLHDMLDEATSTNWVRISDAMLERGHTPEEVIEAWKALEKVCHRSGTAPSLCDF